VVYKDQQRNKKCNDHGNTCVISCVSFNLHIFDNRYVTCRISTCLTTCHTSKVVPQRRYNQGYLGYTLEECMSQHFLQYKLWGVITRNLFRPEPSFRPKTISYRLHRDSGFGAILRILIHRRSDGSAPPSYASRQYEMNILFIALALFGGKSG